MPEDIKNEQTNEETKPTEKTPEVNPEHEMQIQEMMNQLAKYKTALDKATHEAKENKDKYRSLLSEQERASEEKAEAEARRAQEVEELRRKVSLNELEKMYIGMGYSVEQANRASVARLDGDTKTEFAVQAEVNSATLKAKEDEWLASRPEITSGRNKDKETDPFLLGWG